MRREKRLTVVGLTVVYAALAASWIIVTDIVLGQLVSDTGQLVGWQIAKGIGFVLFTAGMFYLLLRYHERYRGMASAAVHEAERDYRVALELGRIMIAQLDRDLRYVWIHNPVEGFSSDVLLGRRIDEVVPDDAGREALAQQRRVLESGEGARHENVFVLDGEPHTYSVVIDPLFDDEGAITGLTTSAIDITALNQARQALEESEARYRRLAENAQDIVFRCRVVPAFAFEFINPYVTDVLDYSPEAFYADPQLPLKIVHPDDRARLTSLVDTRAFHTLHQLRWQHRDSHVVWTEQRIVPVYDERKQIIALEGIARDITARKEAEEALRQNEQRLAILMSNLPGMVYRCRYDPQWTMDFISEGGEALTGYPAEKLLNNRDLSYADLIHTHDRQYVWDTISQAIREQDSFLINYRITTASGQQKWVSEQGRALSDDQGQIQAIEGFITDITDRVQAQAFDAITGTLTSTLDMDVVMNRLLQELKRIVPHDAANIMLIEGDHAVSRYWLGYPDSYLEFLRSFRVPLSAENLRMMLETGEPYLIRDTAAFDDWVVTSETAQLRSSAETPIRAHGTIIGFLSIDSYTPNFFSETHLAPLKSFASKAAVAIENAQLYAQVRQHASLLEERVEARTRELTQTKDQIEAIFENSSDIILLVDRAGAIQRVNTMAVQVFDRAMDELIGQKLSEWIRADDRTEFLRVFETVVRQQRQQRVELTVQTGRRTVFDADIALSPIVEQAGESEQVARVVASLRDITDRKNTERQMRHMLQREMELSDLKSRYVSMASHELRNPLSVAQMSLDLIDRYRHRLTDDQIDQEFDKIRSSIHGMIEMLNNMLTIGRVESGRLEYDPEPIIFDELCRVIINEHQDKFVERERIAYRFSGDRSLVQADPRLVRHILTNLLSNAIKYSPEESLVDLDVQQTSGEIRVTVRDQGIGIPAKDQVRLFEAFHRGENVGKRPGSGLGLTIVKQAVDMHGGEIMFESEEGVGTTFVVVLPAVEPVAAS